MATRTTLTQTRIGEATCPPDKSELVLWDSVQPGLIVRVRPSGQKSFALRYRPGGGRDAPVRKLTIGDVGTISLADARKVARQRLGEVAAGRDPTEEGRAKKSEAKLKARSLLSVALTSYDHDLERRGIVNRAQWMSALRRDLLGKIGDVDVRDLDRPRLVGLFRRIADEGRPGAAKDLRTRVAVLLNWCTNEGLIVASPLAGYRNPRRSRSQIVDQAGRAIEDWELPILWRSFEEADDPVFAAYLRALLLTGQRRTETALMCWSGVDLEGGVWTIPAAVAKSARAHRVPVPAELRDVLRAVPRQVGCDLVFPGRGDVPMSGFSKRLLSVYEASREEGLAPWTLHDLRRTVRTGLGALKIMPHIAELALNHALSAELARIYDRHEYWPERVDAAQRWAAHVLALVNGKQGRVVQLRAAEQ